MSAEPDGHQKITVAIGDFDLWYRVPAGREVSVGGEFLVAAALLPAMVRGEALILPDACPIDDQFRTNVDALQSIYLGWQGALDRTLTRVEVRARHRSAPVEPSPGAMTFFSGGVDGAFTAMRHRSRTSLGVLLRGVDMQLANDALWQAAQSSVERLAAHWEMPVVSIATNIRFLAHHYGLRWSRHYQGAGLASVAHLIPHQTTLIAASHAVACLDPNGSHPLTDPLWSSSTTAVVHDGAVPRTEKIRALANDPVVLDVLRVCWMDNGYNCGKCEKCVRTMVALRLLGARASSFPPHVDLTRLDVLRVDRGGRLDYLNELLALEQERPDPAIRNALKAAHRAGLLRSGLRDIDEAVGGVVGRVRRRSRPAQPSPFPERRPPHVLVYDGDCVVCRRVVSRLWNWDRHHRLEIVAAQTPGIRQRFPSIPPDAYAASVQLIAPDGQVWQGAAAMERAIDLLPKGRLVTWVFALPFARPIAERAYRGFARNRYRLGCGDHCAYRPGAG